MPRAEKKSLAEPALRYRAVVERVSEGYVARVAEFPDLVAKNTEILRCVARLERLLQARIDALVARGQPVLPPSREVTVTDTKAVHFSLNVFCPYDPETVQLDLDPEMARRIDKTGNNRTTFLIEAAERYLAECESKPTEHPRPSDDTEVPFPEQLGHFVPAAELRLATVASRAALSNSFSTAAGPSNALKLP